MALIKCVECGKEISDKALNCPHCGNHLIPRDYSVPISTKLISFFIPFLGLIIYALNIGKNEKLAKKSGQCALIGFVTLVGILFLLIYISNSREVPITEAVKVEVVEFKEDDPHIKIEDYKGKNYLEVKDKLEAEGIEVVVIKQNSSSYKKNVIIDQEPQAGKLLNKKSFVTLYVSKR